MLFYCCTTADILTKHLQQCFLFFIVGNSQVSVYRTIGPTLVLLFFRISNLCLNYDKTVIICEIFKPKVYLAIFDHVTFSRW